MTLDERLAHLRRLSAAHCTTEGAFSYPALARQELNGREILTEALSIINELQEMAHIARSHIAAKPSDKIKANIVLLRLVQQGASAVLPLSKDEKP